MSTPIQIGVIAMLQPLEKTGKPYRIHMELVDAEGNKIQDFHVVVKRFNVNPVEQYIEIITEVATFPNVDAVKMRVYLQAILAGGVCYGCGWVDILYMGEFDYRPFVGKTTALRFVLRPATQQAQQQTQQT